MAQQAEETCHASTSKQIKLLKHEEAFNALTLIQNAAGGKRVAPKKKYSKPLMVDISVQTLTPSQLQTDLGIGTSMTNSSYLQMPVIPAQSLNTAFISSPKKDQDTSDASTPSPPPSPDKTDSDYILFLKFIGQTQYYSIQKDIAIPAIDHYYSLQREVVLQQLQGKQLVLGGDGRCDSPGYSAKYCTYTFMDTLTGVIPDFSLVQVNETTSSTEMELIGFQRSLSNIEDANLAVDVLVTDRHVQIRKAMITDHSDKNHQFDVWHLSKSEKKKILVIKPKKLPTEVKPWIPSICNHVWWCSRDPKDKLEETWTSLLYHISNRHTFPGKLVTKCGHPPLSADAITKKKWLLKDSPAYEASEKVITNKLILRDIRHLDRFCHWIVRDISFYDVKILPKTPGI
ncbi:uncharacterized protein LOC134717799 [Mytilus trossulus]|uniref:uncharacterized protein LOC134717799 n=1 Tax=Mytilus trossulus TaxID=6551 RepID=UPI0030077888